MKKLTTMILVSAATLGIISCKKGVVGEGPSVSQPRAISSFQAIDLRMAGDVYYKNDTACKLEIVAQQNILNMIETTVNGNTLVIRFNGRADYRSSSDIRINVSGPGVNSFNVTTAGSIYGINAISAPNLFLQTTGSGSVLLQEVTAGSIEAIAATSGSIKATSGTAVNANLKTSGSGSIDLINVTTANVTAETSGSGDIRLRATNQLNARVEGSGSIYFTGYPNVSSHVLGSGHLVHF